MGRLEKPTFFNAMFMGVIYFLSRGEGVKGQVLMEGACPPVPLMKGFSADKVI